MNRRLLFFFVAGVTAVLLGVLFSQARVFQQAAPTPTPSPRLAAKPPAISLTQNAPLGVAFIYSGSETSTPKTLPTYSCSWEKPDTARISAVFKKTSPPFTMGSGTQSLLIWGGDGSELSFHQDGARGNWSYVAKNPTAAFIKTTSPVDSLSLLTTITKPPAAGNIVFVKERGGSFANLPLEDPSFPSLREYVFSFLVNNSFPLVGSSFNETLASVVVDRGGMVRAITFSLLPSLDIKSTNKELLSVQEAILSLNRGLGVLVFSGNGSDDDFVGEDPSFQSVQLTDFKIVYYSDTQKGEASPFYLFNGEATTLAGKTIRVQYAVSAVE